jgi:hypothetical protein
MTDTQNLLHDFSSQADFAREHDTTVRTVSRYRALGLPWTRWNGEIWIGPHDEARAWLLKRVRRTGAK